VKTNEKIFVAVLPPVLAALVVVNPSNFVLAVIICFVLGRYLAPEGL
jgi:hypothetical protein